MRLSGQPFCSAASISGSSLALLAHHAADDVAEESRLGGKILIALDLAADPVALELREDLVKGRAGHVHLIERLHGREPRGAAAIGLALFGCSCGHGVNRPQRGA